MRLLQFIGSLPLHKVLLLTCSFGRNLLSVFFTLLITGLFSFENLETQKPYRNSPFPKSGISGDSMDLVLSFAGNWISDDGSYIEVWEGDADTLLVGAGYQVKDGNKQRTEKLAIVFENGRFYYEATVSGQNQGQTISFGPAVFSDSMVTFENKNHDFPNIIRYIFQNDSTLKVSVESLTDPGMNFTIEMGKK